MMKGVAVAFVQPSLGRTSVVLDDQEVARLRAEFDERQSLLLPHFFPPEFLAAILPRIEAAAFEEKENKYVGRDMYMERNATLHALHLAASDPVLLRSIEAITGVNGLRSFLGRVYRMVPSTGHALDWHDDGQEEIRSVALTVNLTREPFEGGVFQIRWKDQPGRILRAVHNTGFGDAVIFRVNRLLEHCVTPLTGQVVRTAFAGWFGPETSYLDRFLDGGHTH
jgi:hypothetical protein